MSANLSFEYEFTDDIAIRVTPIASLNAKFFRAMPAMFLLILASAALLVLAKGLKTPSVLLEQITEYLLKLIVGLFVVMVFLQCVAIVLIWRARRRLRNWAASLRERKIRWTFSDNSFSVHTSESDREMLWGDVRSLKTGAEFWTVSIKNGLRLLLPVVYLTDEIRELIRTRTAGLAKS